MKRTSIFGLTVLVALFLVSCGPTGSIKAGSATAEALVRLLPKSTGAVIAVDVHRGVGTGQAAKMLENPMAKEQYEAFVKMIGIDPLKDVYFLVFGLSGLDTPDAQEGAAIVNLRYDKEPLLALLREKVPNLLEEDHGGITVYSGHENTAPKKAVGAAFLDESNIVVGTEGAVKGIIDVYQKKADSVLKNKEMAGILKTLDKTAMSWSAFMLPADLIKKGAEAVPQLKVLEGITAATVSFDHRLANYILDLRTAGGTKEQNENLASTLTGLKGLAGMLSGQEPAVGDLVNAIEVSSGKDFVRLYVSVSDEVMDKLGQAAQARLGDLIKAEKEGPKEEPKPEIKK